MRTSTDNEVAIRTRIDPTIATKKFACDLARCKGACCTIPGEYGAPLLDSEIEEIKKALPVVVKYLSERHLSAIDQVSLYTGRPGSYLTPVMDRQACAFVTFEAGVAKCAFEKAFWNREIDWQKPLSCHLFPIRIERGRTDRLRFEELHQCQAGIERGESENVHLSDFLQSALERAYGPEWYGAFQEQCRLRRDGVINEFSDLTSPR